MGESIDIYHHSRMNAMRRSRIAYETALRSGKFVGEHCYYSLRGGGNVLFMRGHFFHEDEITVAKVFADNGYNVLMTPETGGLWVSKISNKGTPKYVEGRINGKKYEQGTIGDSVINPIGRVRNILNHAVDKGATIAVVYDKYAKLNKESITEGVSSFIRNGHNRNKVKSLFTVTSDKQLSKFDLI